MDPMQSTDEVLEFAIAREQESADFYTNLSHRAENPNMRQVFVDFAREERGHKAKLIAIRDGRLFPQAAPGGPVRDLKIADYVVEISPTPEMNYQDALIVAMQREKASFRLYTDLARSIDEPELKQAFLALAQEEAKHKLRFEVEYDQVVLREN